MVKTQQKSISLVLRDGFCVYLILTLISSSALRVFVGYLFNNIIFAIYYVFIYNVFMLIILPIQGLVKGFFGHHKCPSHAAWKKVFLQLGWAGNEENAGAKMFAAKLLLIASTASLVLYLLGLPQWKIPCTALVVFSFLEWVFSFYIACSAYSNWHQYFPPKQC